MKTGSVLGVGLVLMAAMGAASCGGSRDGGRSAAIEGRNGAADAGTEPSADAGTGPSIDAGTSETPLDCTARGACADARCAREAVCQVTESGASCDVFAQDCADGRERCYPYQTGTHNGRCYRDGTRVAGQSCEEPPYGEPEACRKGLLCVAVSEDPGATGTCMTVCRIGGRDCAPNEGCATLDTGDEVSFSFGVCVTLPPPPPPRTDCDPLTQARCTSTQTCAIYDQAGTACVTAGSGVVVVIRRLIASYW